MTNEAYFQELCCIYKKEHSEEKEEEFIRGVNFFLKKNFKLPYSRLMAWDNIFVKKEFNV